MNSIVLIKKGIKNAFDFRIFRTLLPYWMVLNIFNFFSHHNNWLFLQSDQSRPEDYLFFSVLGSIARLFWLVLVIYLLQSLEEKVLFSPPKFKLIFEKAWELFLALMVSFFFICLGFLCFIVPGIFLCKRYIFVPIVAATEMLGPIQSMRRSRELSKGRGWSVLLTYILAWGAFYIIFRGLFSSPTLPYQLSSILSIITYYITSISLISILTSAYNQTKVSINTK